MASFGLDKKSLDGIFFAAIFLTYAFLARTHIMENDSSRVATIESIVERHTFAIDDASIQPKVDKILVNGKFYSDKPPVFSVIASGVYFGMHEFFGLSFVEGPEITYNILTALVIGLSTTALLYFFHRSLDFTKLDEIGKKTLTVMLGFGTLLLPYSLVLNNHAFAAALIFIAFHSLLRIKFKVGDERRNALTAGFLVSLAATIDIPVGLVYTALFFAYLVWVGKNKKTLAAYITGAVPSFLVHAIFNIHVVGDLMLPQMHAEYLTYPGSYWSNPMGIDARKDGPCTYAVNILFGMKGIYVFTPVLLISTLTAAKLALGKKHRFRREAVITITATAAIILGYVMASWIFGFNYYGGTAFGFRNFLAATPILFYFTAFALGTRWETSGALLLSGFFSFFVALSGVDNPWRSIQEGEFAKMMLLALTHTLIIAVAALFILRRIAMSRGSS